MSKSLVLIIILDHCSQPPLLLETSKSIPLQHNDKVAIIITEFNLHTSKYTVARTLSDNQTVKDINLCRKCATCLSLPTTYR